MADRLVSAPDLLFKKYKDMGDGSFAEVVYNAGNTGAASASSTPYAVTQTSVTVGTASTQLIAANPNRKYLAWMVIGTADVTVVPGAGPAVAGAGLVYQASGAGKQGASEEFPSGAPSNAFQCVAAAAGSTVIVWEGA